MKVLSSIFIFLILISSAYAEANGMGGDEFRKTVAEYQMKAEKYNSK